MRIITLAVFGLCASLAPASAQTAEEHYEYLHSKCGPMLEMSKSECDCIIAMAKSDLKGRELDVAVLMVKRDNEGIAKMQTELSGEQMGNAMSFVSQAPTKCRNK